jgi:hypothetical protein
MLFVKEVVEVGERHCSVKSGEGPAPDDVALHTTRNHYQVHYHLTGAGGRLRLWPLTSTSLVGATGFEPVTSAV